MRSGLVKECQTTLPIALNHFVIRQIWVPGHSGIVDNSKAKAQGVLLHTSLEK